MPERNGHDEQNESNYSGKLGERNRNTPGRTPRELGLDRGELRAHDIVGETPDRVSGGSPDADLSGDRRNPDLTPDAGGLGEGGISGSGGRAGGARGNSGTSDSGAGGPEGESLGGPGEYKSTSRVDLDRGSE